MKIEVTTIMVCRVVFCSFYNKHRELWHLTIWQPIQVSRLTITVFCIIINVNQLQYHEIGGWFQHKHSKILRNPFIVFCHHSLRIIFVPLPYERKFSVVYFISDMFALVYICIRQLLGVKATLIVNRKKYVRESFFLLSSDYSF